MQPSLKHSTTFWPYNVQDFQVNIFYQWSQEDFIWTSVIFGGYFVLLNEDYNNGKPVLADLSQTHKWVNLCQDYMPVDVQILMWPETRVLMRNGIDKQDIRGKQDLTRVISYSLNHPCYKWRDHSTSHLPFCLSVVSSIFRPTQLKTFDLNKVDTGLRSVFLRFRGESAGQERCRGSPQFILWCMKSIM